MAPRTPETSWIVRLKKLVLPPAGPLLLAFAGLALLHTSRQGLGLALLLGGLGLLYLLSSPWFGALLLRTLDRYPFVDLEAGSQGAEAIVILDGGRLVAPTQRGGITASPRTLERMHEGVRLHRNFDLPILASGYGELMATILADTFDVETRWIENASTNTHENAVLSARILHEEGIARVFLVTHTWHLRRALAAFAHAGIDAVPAPAGRTVRQPSDRGLMSLVPSIAMLNASHLALHEWIGIVWYRLRYGHANK